MKWAGVLERGLIVLVALSAWPRILTRFPDMSWAWRIGLALVIGGIGFMADSMFDGALSPYGRALVGFVVTFGLLSIAFSHLVYPHAFLTRYAEAAVLTGALVALGDVLIGRIERQKSMKAS
ncbi:hypothetical protein TPY_3002 [Sulfobacillus acidophilus TPY]|uniref:Uncharacterized protein n=1 Tax=Sulfobacillus acidophilus (strain ATCC 700253 / DSM 10332 / NAL) TaxID=679936 RepID=G8TS66_SULAD|nr:hypothetical protein TPY_3002 [Sulfobacillus acidophilus TPY]AEW04392.1 hypothetical protein Sulac_0889 [Sulfobacillus acidophilus DSM 10332]